MPQAPGEPTPVFTPAAAWQASARPLDAGPAVLSGDDSGPPVPDLLAAFTPVGTALDFTLEAPAAVLSAEPESPGTLAFTPDDDGAYVLLHLIETDAGLIYDFTLPQPASDDGPLVLSGGRPALVFPVNPVAVAPPPPAEAATLGLESLIGGAVGTAIGEAVKRRVLQMIRAPLSRALLAGVAKAEGEPQVVALRADAPVGQRFQPLAGAEAWRSLLPPAPGGEPARVLLFLHGFGSSTARSSAENFLPALASGYQAVLGYDHPTLARDPLQNALELLAQVPPDLRLSVDIIAHSRGSLVARSLVELIEPLEQFVPRVIITCGGPHQGTELANPQRWDRLISLTMTGVSWLATLTGFATPIPQILEWVLRAAAEGAFGLPGLAAMAPGTNPFLAQLNAAADPASTAGGLQARVRYAAVTSRFSLFNVPQLRFRQAFEAIAAQAFINQPNDLVVPTASMGHYDGGHAGTAHLSGVNHWSYFSDQEVLGFIRGQLAG